MSNYYAITQSEYNEKLQASLRNYGPIVSVGSITNGIIRTRSYDNDGNVIESVRTYCPNSLAQRIS